jgi:hypothetical protein
MKHLFNNSILACFLSVSFLTDMYAQQGISAAGGDAAGSGGKASYTIGGLIQSQESDNYIIETGVQHAYGMIEVSVSEITVGGQLTERNENNFSILAECHNDYIDIGVTADPYATVNIGGVAENPRRVVLPGYGENNIDIVVSTANGNTQTYILKVHNPIPATVAHYNRFDDVLTVPVQIEGFGVVDKVEWYRDGVLLDRDPFKGYIEMTEPGNYYAFINNSVRSCEVTHLRKASALSMTVFPNPAFAEEEITVYINHDEDELKDAILQVHGIDGRLLQTLPVSDRKTTLKLPPVTGTVIVKLLYGNRNRETKVIIK